MGNFFLLRALITVPLIGKTAEKGTNFIITGQGTMKLKMEK